MRGVAPLGVFRPPDPPLGACEDVGEPFGAGAGNGVAAGELDADGVRANGPQIVTEDFGLHGGVVGRGVPREPLYFAKGIHFRGDLHEVGEDSLQVRDAGFEDRDSLLLRFRKRGGFRSRSERLRDAFLLRSHWLFQLDDLAALRALHFLADP